MDSHNLDYLIRSVVTAVIALALVGSVVICVLTGRALDTVSGSVLISSAGVVIGYYFGQNASINGKILADKVPPGYVVENDVTEDIVE